MGLGMGLSLRQVIICNVCENPIDAEPCRPQVLGNDNIEAHIAAHLMLDLCPSCGTIIGPGQVSDEEKAAVRERYLEQIAEKS